LNPKFAKEGAATVYELAATVLELQIGGTGKR
jgi:hypothetical protein